MAFDGADNLFFADSGANLIRKVAVDGSLSTVAGTGAAGFVDGPVAQAQFNAPKGIAFDSAGAIYVADPNNNRIRKIGTDGAVSTYAGTGVQFGPLGDGGPATLASITNPTDVAVDGAGNLLVVDQSGERLRRITPGGSSRLWQETAGPSLPAMEDRRNRRRSGFPMA